MFTRILRAFDGLFHRRALDRAMDEEMKAHLDFRVDDLVRAGVPRDDAVRRARVEFGNVTAAQETARAAWGWMWFANIAQDVRYAIRTLMRSPTFTLAAVITLALGIGANTAMFTVVNAFLYRPLPVANPDNLVLIGTASEGSDLTGDTSYPNFLDIASPGGAFADATAYTMTSVTLRVGDAAQHRYMEAVSDNYWPMMGVHAAVGRMFSADDARARIPAIVISYGLWQRAFNGDTSVVGRAVSLNGLAATIIGVAPQSFHGAEPLIAAEGWYPATLMLSLFGGPGDPLERRTGGGFKVLARLGRGASVQQAQGALDVLASSLRARYASEMKGVRFVLRPELRARPDIGVADVLPRIAFVFMSLTALVLLVACANATALMLARANRRQAEFALRTAIGATRSRLALQVLTETGIIAVMATAGGALLATGAQHWLTSIPIATDSPAGFDLHPDWHVFGFAAVAACAAAIASGLLPAIRGTTAPPGDVLKEGSRTSAGGAGGQRLRAALVVGQIAVAFLLLVFAGLLTQSTRRAADVALGFRTDHELIATVDVSMQRYDQPAGERFYAELIRRARETPGVRSAALASTIPLGTSHQSADIYADLPTLATTDGHTTAERIWITPNYFETLGIPFVAGRDFASRDSVGAEQVAVVNAAMARRLWPTGSPIGQRIRLVVNGPLVQIVGEVQTAKSGFVSEAPRAAIYLPFAQSYTPRMTLHLYTDGDPATFGIVVRSLVTGLDANMAVYDIFSMSTHLHDGVAFLFTRLAAQLAAAFGLIGLIQALVGLYGVVAYSVALRRREIGIRMAIGASGAQVLRDVVAQGMRMATGGMAIGFVLAIASTRVLTSLLNGVSATDADVYVSAVVALGACTLIATFIPAWRASSLHPMDTLRGD